MTKDPSPTGKRAHCHSGDPLIEHQTRLDDESASARTQCAGTPTWLAQSLLFDFSRMEEKRRRLFLGFITQYRELHEKIPNGVRSFSMETCGTPHWTIAPTCFRR